MYVEHGDRLDRLARWVSAERALTLIPLQNSLMRLIGGFTFYLLLPVTVLLFAWKAAVFPNSGLALFSVAAAVIASHVMLPFSKFSWRFKGLLGVGAALIAGAVMLDLGEAGFPPPRRPFNLFRANLPGQWLPGDDLRKANLIAANLAATNLKIADLSGAKLDGANLSGANVSGAELSGANLSGADLRSANLSDAKIT
jgi:hypothetical protein